MNLFARPVQDMPEPFPRRVRRAFVALFVVGAVLRAIAGFTTLSIIFPDEHQQFLEQAHRMVYGYGLTFWEQDRGMRHPLYPALLAIPLAVMKTVGIADPMIQASLIRWGVSLLALMASALFAWEFQRRGDSRTALVLMFLFALSPDVLFTHIHPLSEVAATIPFLIALAWLDRRPFWAGILLGMSFGIRFQMGFLVAGTVFLAWLSNWGSFNRPFLKLAGGVILSLAALGFTDWIVFGEWFHSPLEYVQANLVEGIANQWGVLPWYQYIVWLGHDGWLVIIPLAILVAIGARKEPMLLLLIVSFVFPHMLVAHKEARFMLPVAPLALALAARGYTEIAKSMGDRYRGVWFIFGLTALAAIAVIRFPMIRWNNEPYRSSAVLFRSAGMREDLTGIGFVGSFRENTANHFYLRRNVPIIVAPYQTFKEFEREAGDHMSVINYVVCHPGLRSEFEGRKPEAVDAYGEYTLFRIEPVKKP